MKVGIVGCGQIATVHIPYIRALPDTTIVAVTDHDPARASEMAARFGIAGVSRTVDELVARHRPDVVHILTPPQTHAPLALQAMHAGCHVLVEKPMAVNLEEAEAMEAAARLRGVKLCVDHNHLFDPAVVAARARGRGRDRRAGLGRDVRGLLRGRPGQSLRATWRGRPLGPPAARRHLPEPGTASRLPDAGVSRSPESAPGRGPQDRARADLV